MNDLLRYWLTFERPVDRSAYLRHGLALVAVKYGVDALLIGLAAGTVWTPLDYATTPPLILSNRLGGAPAFLSPVLVAWTLPFLWIGVTMTIRRLVDAGRSAWWSLLFFVPYLSWALIALLVIAPSSERRIAPDYHRPDGARLPSALLSMAVGVLTGLALISVGVLWIESYGLAVFMGTPFVLGLVTAFVLRRRYEANGKEAMEVVAMTTALLGGAAFALGFEGAVCLAMVAPLGIVVAMMGGLVGRHLASQGERPLHGVVLISLLMPAGASVEGDGGAVQLREVRSAVVVEAPPSVVWEHVIEFSPLAEPTSLLFRAGLAYPTHAEIVGEGVGAIRYCHFSTGAFVEPITVWEPGERLAFDVTESPPPLREITPWAIDPPHLEGYLAPRAGEFRLIGLPSGATRLEGSTWYEQRLRPEGYWVLFSDFIIARIHERVLDHIQTEAEAAGTDVNEALEGGDS